MSDISSWAVSICAAAVLGAAFGMVFSDSRYERVLRLVMSAVMVCVIISPITEMQSCNAGIDAGVESY
ncbi:MAG: hypothetical protein IJP17_02540, partial [Clostridia bacterium]|nr:hypothetical protein [Clostridia bacterium]